jgi:diguanylate cyclase (GGDEF)-like protein
MDHVLGRMIAGGRAFSLMHLDLDFFKAVNDTMGHAAGDLVLAHVAQAMVDHTRSVDTVARVGGDEFVILFDGLTDRKRLENVARRLIKELEKPIPVGGASRARISASAGTVLSLEYDRPEAAQMLADADLALYTSKRMGRACHTFFEPEMRDEAVAPAPPPARDVPEAEAGQARG